MTDTALAPLMIERRTDGGAVLWLDAPGRPVVVMNRTLLEQLDAAITQLAEDLPAWLVVASTSDRSFVAGADLGEIDSLDDDALTAYMVQGQRVFGRLADFPRTVVAAVRITLCGAISVVLAGAVVADVADAACAPAWLRQRVVVVRRCVR